ncbi:PRC-barrel domain-containing protein [Qipengyuania atrilutea]|uniref:PRC-barrel domain-containing protein n=1 Tax=Qipengyuania atrilutea TaxID=2744473 RepID=A0A850HDN4_9SPHN|nr:PRC-barrel domain-containing protein [Actirhodobacter atriluteus]NVD45279.1 PRC-barrel domain-containing protein [Actirhodobacter atriluteus]
MAKNYEDLHELDSYQLENSEQDLRGHALYTYDGERLGTVQRMLVDPDRNHVAALVLEDHRFVPVSEIEIRDGDAYIDPVDATGFSKVPKRERNIRRGTVTVNRRT